MKKTLFIVGMALVMSGYVFVGDAIAMRPGDRQAMQQERICQGVKTGELTRAEVRMLQSEQSNIRCARKEMWADGRLSPRERMCLDRMQDRAGRHIYLHRHNDRMAY